MGFITAFKVNSALIVVWLSIHFFRYIFLASPGAWFSFAQTSLLSKPTTVNSFMSTPGAGRDAITASSIRSLENFLRENQVSLHSSPSPNNVANLDICPIVVSTTRDHPYWTWITSLLLQASLEDNFRDVERASIGRPTLLVISNSNIQPDAGDMIPLAEKLKAHGALKNVIRKTWDSGETTEKSFQSFRDQLPAWKECSTFEGHCLVCLISDDLAMLDKSFKELRPWLFRILLLADRNALHWNALFISTKGVQLESTLGAPRLLLLLFVMVALVVSPKPQRAMFMSAKVIIWIFLIYCGIAFYILPSFDIESMNSFLQQTDLPRLYLIKPTCARLLVRAIEGGIDVDNLSQGIFIANTCGRSGNQILTFASPFLFSAAEI
jgi:hypothetical protein